jgi:hypothetical protein
MARLRGFISYKNYPHFSTSFHPVYDSKPPKSATDGQLPSTQACQREQRESSFILLPKYCVPLSFYNSPTLIFLSKNHHFFLQSSSTTFTLSTNITEGERNGDSKRAPISLEKPIKIKDRIQFKNLNSSIPYIH